ncbi:MAG: carbohydrate ABC transporter permease [Chloroflexota bacterium]|nr:MAG: carbohydrate ABC transporter permease [Chloroflexota bacterium]
MNPPSRNSSSFVLVRHSRKLLAASSLTLFAFMLLSAFLSPFLYMLATAVKTPQQFTTDGAPIWPAKEATYTYEGEELTIYQVPTAEGMQEWALFKPGRDESQFIDPDNPGAGPVQWTGAWRTLEKIWRFDPVFENFLYAWEAVDFPKVFSNTFIVAALGMLGTTISCTLVAYGFARFRLPGKNILFILLMSTVFLPGMITLAPKYVVYQKLGWIGTWAPLIVPHFFANAWNVFLLRQYFLTLPREIDEAAMVDGAGPLRTLLAVVLPQSWAAVLVVMIGHFVWAWNDFFEPLLYLGNKTDLYVISVAIQKFNNQFENQPHFIQATSLLGLILPLTLFFLAQRYFMQGIVITGVEK